MGLRIFYFVWIEPVRDWNISFTMRTPPVLIGVNWTCEGLKRKHTPKPHNAIKSVNWTCEGLKLGFNRFLDRGFLVWIEPVRDWNFSDLTISYRWPTCVNWTCEGLKLTNPPFSFCFLHLCELNLWGIETSFPSYLIQMFCKCELNLWGIETVFLSEEEIKMILVWIEPVRDWNGCGWL